MTRALAKEFGGRGICVNAVCPGKGMSVCLVCSSAMLSVCLSVNLYVSLMLLCFVYDLILSQ